MIMAEEIPPGFFDFDGNAINVLAVCQGELERFPCPRDNSENNKLVMTNRGIWLYCFDCHIFYPEGGQWGYRTSSNAIKEECR